MIEQYHDIAHEARQLKRLRIKLDYQTWRTVAELDDYQASVAMLSATYADWLATYQQMVNEVKTIRTSDTEPLLIEHAGYSLQRVTDYVQLQGHIADYFN